MSDLFLFVIGTIVTTMVGSAVALLFYGAAREPREKPIRVEIVRRRHSAPESTRRGPSERSRRYSRSWTRSF